MEKNKYNRILVIDDEQSLRDLYQKVLHSEGYEVVTAASGEEGLKLFKEKPCHLVFVDLRLPNMSGLDLINIIKKDSPETEVILITAYASVENAISAIRYGVYDYLIKPIDDIGHITTIARRAMEKIRLTRENSELVQEVKSNNEELLKANMILSQMAVRDDLTGLFNQRYIKESLEHEEAVSLRYDRKFSLMMLDIDHFKIYNDTNGHQAGDKVLSEFSNIMTQKLRQSDVAARYGGEEFLLILPETPKEGARMLAEKILQDVANHPFENREKQPLGFVSVSIGVAAYPDDGESSKTVIHEADKALYRAKHEGRNRTCMAGDDKQSAEDAILPEG